MKVVIEMYTGASEDPVEIRELSVGDTFDDLSDQWSWFRVAAFTSTEPIPTKVPDLRGTPLAELGKRKPREFNSSV